MPTWSDNVSIIAAAVLAKGSTSRGTIDLRSSIGAYIFCKIGRGGIAAFDTGCKLQIRRVLNNDVATAGGIHPCFINFPVNKTAATANTTVAVDSNAGQAELKLASISSIAVGDLLCIQDSGGGVTRLEFVKVSKLTVGSGTGVTLDRNLQFSHTAVQADTVRNAAEVFTPQWVEGGSLLEVIFDFGLEGTANSVTVQALAQQMTAS